MEHRRWKARARAAEVAETTALTPDRRTVRSLREATGVELRQPTSWAGFLRRHDVPLEAARLAPGVGELSAEDRAVVVGRLRYAGYVERARRERGRLERLRALPLPPFERLKTVPGLSNEVLEALERDRPPTVGHAERLPGVTPAAVAILVAHLAGGERRAG